METFHMYTPLARSAPAFVLLFSVFILQESTTVWGVVGILLVVLGAYSINMKSLTLRGLLDPFRALQKDHALQYALLTLITVTLYTIIDDRGVEFLHPILYFFIINTGSWLLFTIYIFRNRTRTQYLGTVQANWGTIFANAILGTGSYVLMLVAYTIERASYASGLRQISIPIAVLLGGQLLKENHQKVRLTAACAICAGAMSIVMGG